MNIEYDTKDKLLVLKITEEIDHHTTEKIRRRADYEINRLLPRKVIFDFNSVTFMDSAGIGFLIGRYKEAKVLGGETEIINVRPSIKKVLEMCGVSKLIPIVEKG